MKKTLPKRGLLKPWFVPDYSMDEIDRASFQAGPAPLASRATGVKLRKPGSRATRHAPPDTLSLDGEWQLAEGGDARQRLKIDWSDAIPAEVPGSVHSALVAAGKLPDPTFGRNQEIAQKASYKTWWLKRTFKRPEGDGPFTLVFHGVCNVCAVWLNGSKLGGHEGMFGGPEFDVTGRLREENTLVVRLDAIPVEGDPTNNTSWQHTVVFNNVYGWHYSQCPSLGVWRRVELSQEPTVSLQAPYVTAQDIDGTADLVVHLVGEGMWSGVLSGTIEPENFKGETLTFRAPAKGRGSKSMHLRFRIPDPQLWWPNGMGAQNLYRMTLAFQPDGGGRADGRHFTFGLRTIEMAPFPEGPRPEWYDWTFVINGKPTFVKGTGWCTMDPFMDFRRERYDRFLSLARDQHCQMVRAWGSGMPETDDFYDLCDAYGLMVLQEWPTAWNSHNTQPYDILEETVRRNTLRLRHRTSLVMWGANNESSNPFGKAIDMMGRLSIELDGSRPFHRGEPWGGSNHGYPCYWGRQHLDAACGMTSRFWGEFGAACMPPTESVLRYTPKDEQAAWPNVDPKGGFAFHTPIFNRVEGVSRLTQYARYFVPDDADIDQFCVGSQLAQAIALRHPLERARTLWPNSTGALYYKMNDNFPAASWATADWYGAAKIGHYWVQDAFAPLHACCLFDRLNHQGTPLSAQVFLLDDLDVLADKSWTVLIRAFDEKLAECARWENTGKGSIGSPHKFPDALMPYGTTNHTPLFIVAEVLVRGRLADRTFYILNVEAEKGSLFTRPKTTLSLRAKGKRATVTNTGKRPAIAVNIERPGHLDTFTVSDNFFWLDAGESTTVQVSDTDGLRVSAWNVKQTEVM